MRKILSTIILFTAVVTTTAFAEQTNTTTLVQNKIKTSITFKSPNKTHAKNEILSGTFKRCLEFFCN